MVMAHGVESEGAEPEGGQCCDSRWKFLFEETEFSAALLIRRSSSQSVTFGKKKKFSSVTSWDQFGKNYTSSSELHAASLSVCEQCLAHERRERVCA